MKPSYRIGLLALAAAACVAAAFLLAPIPQDPAYHAFADARAFFGVPNFWNVATNLPFLVVGLWGLLYARGRVATELATHYRVYCGAVALVAFGSAGYHLAPSNVSLVWDRLPMTVAFMSLFSALLADRISWFMGRALLWPLVVAGIASIAWWIRGEATGHGDLRAYGLVQFLPMLLVPMILLMWRDGSIAARPLWLGFGVYALAKLAEHFDAAIYAALGFVSGHSLKHLLAAAAAWWIARAFQRSPASAL
jgi:hypothetical protein